MLSEIKHYIDNPDDVPSVPPAVQKYLQAQFSLDYIDAIGHMNIMRAQGNSEQVILGFLLGLRYASATIDIMGTRLEMIAEDSQED